MEYFKLFTVILMYILSYLKFYIFPGDILGWNSFEPGSDAS